MIDKEFAIKILEQYREKPTLINEIETVEEAFNIGDEVMVKFSKEVIVGIITDFTKIDNKEWLRVLSSNGSSCVVLPPKDKVTKTGRSFHKLIEEIHKIGCNTYDNYSTHQI